MEVIIEETGEVKELKLIVNGKDITNKTLSNFKCSYILSPEKMETEDINKIKISKLDFIWWQNYIDKTKELEEQAQYLSKKYEINIEEIWKGLKLPNDYNLHHETKETHLKDFFQKIKEGVIKWMKS